MTTDAVRFAVASGHGVGKTALSAWLVLWFLSTRDHPQVVVTANTAAQLRNKTWRELAKWHRLAANKHWFGWTSERFVFLESPETWFGFVKEGVMPGYGPNGDSYIRYARIRHDRH